MISIETVVGVVLFLLGAGAIFALLFFLISYCEKKFPLEFPLYNWIRVFLVIGGVFVLIGLILDLMGHPIIIWRRP